MKEDEFLSLRKFVCPEFIFGKGAISLAGRFARNYEAKKVLIVTDKGVMKAGWTKKVIDSLNNDYIQSEVFSDVSPNPLSDEVQAGADFYLSKGCDVILAVGGGSPMDCAKAIGIVSTNKRHILEFEGVDKVEFPIPPLICIPTTGGTAADVSQFSIIRDNIAKRKIAIISKAVVPDVSLISPETLVTMDPYLTACTGIDAMVHAIEAFVSNASSPLTDVHAIAAVNLHSQYLLKSISDPNNLINRGKVMLASLEAGLAFSNASLGIVHSLAHSLGGLLDLPHGECNAIMLPHVVNFNFDSAPERYTRLGECLAINFKGMTTAQKKKRIVEKLLKLKKEAGISATLKDKGITADKIRPLAKNALVDPCTITNPRKPKLRDLEVIYEEAL
jgi:alcohol dehydrogenase class IV